MWILFLLSAAFASPPCDAVPHVKSDVFSYSDSRSTPTARWSVETETLPDLHLDEAKSTVVRRPEVELLGSQKDIGSLGWELYIIKDKCPISIGRYSGHAKPTVHSTSHHGMRDFSIMRANPHPPSMCAEHGDACLLLTDYHFDGTRYVAQKPQRR